MLNLSLPRKPRRRSNHFFKIFLPNLSSNHLRIPPAFRQHIERESPARFHLKGPSNSVWVVDLVKESDGLCFANGWKEFVSDHSLATGDFLLFQYNGNSTFSVMIFDNTACEKKGAFSARPTCHPKFDKPRKRNRRIDAAVEVNQTMKRKRTVPDRNNECSAVILSRTRLLQKKVANGTLRRLAASVMGNGSKLSSSSSDLCNEALRCSRAFKLINSNSIMETSVMGNGSKLSRSSSDPCNEALRCSRAFKLINSNSVMKKSGRVISQRRPITQEEKDNAFAKARSFKSRKPFFMMVMKYSHVCHGFYLCLPRSFPIRYLPDVNKKVFLHDPKKRQWAVKYLCSRPSLSAGWSKFAVGNNLETDDVCIFELIQEGHLKVHIFRAVEFH